MEDHDNGRCMHGCYPTDIDKIREIARNEGPAEAEDWLDANQPNGEPYVGADNDEPHHRQIKVVAGSQGIPIDTFLSVMDHMDVRHNYDVRKVAETLHANPGSQLHQEMIQRRQGAEQQINRVLSNVSDLYHQKHLLEHDIRKLEEKAEHFEEKNEEAIKADFVDNVDQHTGRSSIIQMQANNIFPSITADFYSMQSMEDLTEGHLKDLPEQEKAVLRKKWKLYQKWKEKFSHAVQEKLGDVERRLKSVETSIEQTESWIEPYVQTIKQMEGDMDVKIQEMTDPYMLEGYASSVRGLKTISHKVVREKENNDGDLVPTHRDVMVVDLYHISLGGSEQPQAPGQGAEVTVLTFKEYAVCEHIFQEVFKPQIDEREHVVRRYIANYVGDEYPEEVAPHTSKEFQPYNYTFLEKMKHNVLKWLGIGDEYYVPDPSSLREGLMGPKFGGPSPLYLEIKYGIGLYVMK